ncbi:MAG: sigma factor-like helix-turn-helix DNA-binding protein [Ilumatobacteraceae bacterium]
MESAPFTDPETSLEELQDLREAIAEAIEQLPERMRYVLDAVNSERMSIRKLADRMSLSKSQVQRLYQQALEHLRLILIANPIIRRRLGLPAENWNEAALDIVDMMCPIADETDDELMLRMMMAIDDMRSRFHLGSVEANLFSDPAFKMGRAAAGWLANRGKWDVKEMQELLCRKQHDYGHGNINSFGPRGVVVRLSDKMERIKNLLRQDLAPSNESLKDSFDDIVGYCTILLMLANDTFSLELADD